MSAGTAAPSVRARRHKFSAQHQCQSYRYSQLLRIASERRAEKKRTTPPVANEMSNGLQDTRTNHRGSIMRSDAMVSAWATEVGGLMRVRRWVALQG